MDCEFHFQEGFAGDVVLLVVAGEPRMQRELMTRLQIGHAWTESLRIEAGLEATVSIPARDLRAGIRVEPGDRWFLVNLVDGVLEVRRSPTSPGYV